MADDFPDDSLFRNSNVAYLEDALNLKEESQIGKLNQELTTTKPRTLGREFVRENSGAKSQPRSKTGQNRNESEVRVANIENSFGLPMPEQLEIEFQCFGFSDSSTVIKGM